MDNLNDIIERLQAEGRWDSFVKCFGDMRQDVLDEFAEGKIETEKDLAIAKGKIEILDKIMGIEHYARKWWEVRRK